MASLSIPPQSELLALLSPLALDMLVSLPQRTRQRTAEFSRMEAWRIERLLRPTSHQRSSPETLRRGPASAALRERLQPEARRSALSPHPQSMTRCEGVPGWSQQTSWRANDPISAPHCILNSYKLPPSHTSLMTASYPGLGTTHLFPSSSMDRGLVAAPDA